MTVGIMVIAALVLALVLPRVELRHGWRIGLGFDATAAETLLGAVAGAMLTLTGFTFTAVTLIVQTVQSESPRLLRALNRTDRTPLAFGAFIATFAYSLLVLSQVRPDEVPNVSVTIAIGFAVGSAALLLRMLATIQTSLTVGGLVRTIGAQMRRLLATTYPHPYPGAEVEPAPPPADPSWTVAHQGRPGVFQSFDELRLVRLAEREHLHLTLIPSPGDFVATGSALAFGTGEPGDPRAIASLLRIGPARTLEQDPAYGIRLLVDIALRALSPAVNDPTSAVQVLDQLDDLLRRLASRFLGNGRVIDGAGEVRISYPAPTWGSLLGLALDEIILFGAGSYQVSRRTRALLQDLLVAAPEARRAAVETKLASLQRAIERAFPDAEGRGRAARPDRQGLGSARGSED